MRPPRSPCLPKNQGVRHRPTAHRPSPPSAPAVGSVAFDGHTAVSARAVLRVSSANVTLRMLENVPRRQRCRRACGLAYTGHPGPIALNKTSPCQAIHTDGAITPRTLVHRIGTRSSSLRAFYWSTASPPQHTAWPRGRWSSDKRDSTADQVGRSRNRKLQPRSYCVRYRRPAEARLHASVIAAQFDS